MKVEGRRNFRKQAAPGAAVTDIWLPGNPSRLFKYYVETHLPLARKLPGLRASRYSFDVKPLGPGKAPYFCIFEAEFENEAALMGALGSNEGKAVAGDVPNYASGGVTMMHFAVE